MEGEVEGLISGYKYTLFYPSIFISFFIITTHLSKPKTSTSTTSIQFNSITQLQQNIITMDTLKSALGGSKDSSSEESSSGSGGLMDKINSAAGGGKESEKKEDSVDKGMQPPPLSYPILDR